MSGVKSIFRNLDKSIKGTVSFGDHSRIPVLGKGSVQIRLKGGETDWISDVFYVPLMKTNILSLGQLVEKGCEVLMSGKELTLIDKGKRLIARVRMTSNRMFMLPIKSAAAQCMHSDVNSVEWLWHYRLGHLNFDALRLMQRKAMVHGLPSFKSGVPAPCEGCQLGKQTRSAFKNQPVSPASRALEIVHGDICGPFQITSLGGHRYFLLFVDSHSRKTWIYFLKEKSEAFAKFQQFRLLVEK
ncbi:hypothetical protein Dimus_039537 [Dionaea muscipula]